MTVAVNSDPTLPAYDTISYSRLGLPAPPGRPPGAAWGRLPRLGPQRILEYSAPECSIS